MNGKNSGVKEMQTKTDSFVVTEFASGEYGNEFQPSLGKYFFETKDFL
jgi:hypothetical protein